MNDQRTVIYEQRKELMDNDDVSEEIFSMRKNIIEDLVTTCIPEKAYPEQWQIGQLHSEVLRIFNLELPLKEWANEEGIADQEILQRIMTHADQQMKDKTEKFGDEMMRIIEKSLLLQVLDQIWKEHLLTLDHLRHGIGLRAYGQKDPLNEYKREAFSLFDNMLDTVRDRVTMMLSHVELQSEEEADKLVNRNRRKKTQHHLKSSKGSAGDINSRLNEESPELPLNPVQSRRAANNIDPNDQSTWGRIARNAKCPCGSQKKYKYCHGKI